MLIGPESPCVVESSGLLSRRDRVWCHYCSPISLGWPGSAPPMVQRWAVDTDSLGAAQIRYQRSACATGPSCWCTKPRHLHLEGLVFTVGVKWTKIKQHKHTWCRAWESLVCVVLWWLYYVVLPRVQSWWVCICFCLWSNDWKTAGYRMALVMKVLNAHGWWRVATCPRCIPSLIPNVCWDRLQQSPVTLVGMKQIRWWMDGRRPKQIAGAFLFWIVFPLSQVCLIGSAASEIILEHGKKSIFNFCFLLFWGDQND